MRRTFFKRPLWCNYLFAYLLLGLGVSLVDVAAGRTGNIVVIVMATISLLAGLSVFACAIGFSIRFVPGTEPPRINACPKCSYNLKGNTSGVCPECGTEVSGKAGQGA
jgi:hypothetical protein